MVVGWGSITPDGNTAVDQQRSATVPVFADTTCTGFIGTFLADNQVCAGANGVGVCTGDSGGPLFVADTKGTIRLAGVVSYGSDPCDVDPRRLRAGVGELAVPTSNDHPGAGAPGPRRPRRRRRHPLSGTPGYWMLGADGKVYPFGSAADVR